MDIPEARDLQAQSPTEAFWVFTNYEYDIKKGDILINEANTAEVYRVFARVRKYPGHAEIPVELISDDGRQPLPIHGEAEQKEGSQQNDNDKVLASTAMKGFSFYKLVHELLLNLGYKVVTKSKGEDTGIDFLAYYPPTSPNAPTSEQKWVVEVKYRNLAGTLGLDTLYQIYAYSKGLNADKALLVTNFNLSIEAQLFATKSNELEIWDVNKLLALLERFPELKQKYPDVVSQLDNLTLSGMAGLGKNILGSQHELIQALEAMPTGDGKPYEELVKRILEFCFCDEFSPFSVKDQVYTYNKKRIRDFIIDNRSPKVEFWQSLKWVRKVEKILFDAKNYKNPVDYREISDTLRYLKNGAFGNFIIIISRKGIKDYEEALEDYSDTQQIVLVLSDEDLVKMITLKIKGKNPTLLIEDSYYDFLDRK